MTTTVPPLADSAQLARESRWEPLREVLMRAPVFLAVTIVAIGVGWRLTSNALYLGGLILAVVWASVVLARRRDRALVIVVVLAVGFGGPWLGVVLSYQDAGVLVDADLDLQNSHYVTTQGDAVVLAGLVAVDGDGREVWSLPGGAYRDQVPLGDGSFLVADRQDYALVDATGVPVWGFSVEPQVGEVAALGGGAFVLQTCPDTELRGGCAWTGYDLADGTERWELTGRPAPAWPVPDSDVVGDSDMLLSPPSLFGIVGESGATELRDAGTGRVLGEVPGEATALLTRDAAIVVDRAGPCRAELWDREGGGWATEIDCALLDHVPSGAPSTWEEVTHVARPEELGTLVGETWWAGTWSPGEASLVLDLRTGAARTVPAVARRYGGGVVVEYVGDDVTVRDPLDGSRLWGGTHGSDVELGGDLVAFHYDAPLLLDQLFGPDDRERVVEVREARTGEVVARLRSDGDVLVADDRVFVVVHRAATDERTIRMITAD